MEATKDTEVNKTGMATVFEELVYSKKTDVKQITI